MRPDHLRSWEVRVERLGWRVKKGGKVWMVGKGKGGGEGVVMGFVGWMVMVEGGGGRWRRGVEGGGGRWREVEDR